MGAEITLKTMLAFCTVLSVIFSLVTFFLTRYVTILKLKDKFRLKSEAIKCLKERELAESKILQKLDDIAGDIATMDKRMSLGNVIMREIVEKDDSIPNDRIEKVSKDLGLTE